MTTMISPAVITAEEIDPEIDPHFASENRRIAVERIAAGVPRHYAEAVVTVPQIAAWLRNILSACVETRRGPSATLRTGKSLLLLGPTGTGKTHQAYGAVRAIAASGVHCQWRFTTSPDFHAKLRPRHGVDAETVFEQYANAPLLVLDDLGAAKASEWTEETNYRLVNHRYEHELPTLITSNVEPKLLGASLGERVTSRLMEMTERVSIKGEDRRLKR